MTVIQGFSNRVANQVFFQTDAVKPGKENELAIIIPNHAGWASAVTGEDATRLISQPGVINAMYWMNSPQAAPEQREQSRKFLETAYDSIKPEAKAAGRFMELKG